VVSDQQSEAHQLTASVNGLLPLRTMFNANYTLSFARDQGPHRYRVDRGPGGTNRRS
jgi:hypothetical protein